MTNISPSALSDSVFLAADSDIYLHILVFATYICYDFGRGFAPTDDVLGCLSVRTDEEAKPCGVTAVIWPIIVRNPYQQIKQPIIMNCKIRKIPAVHILRRRCHKINLGASFAVVLTSRHQHAIQQREHQTMHRDLFFFDYTVNIKFISI